MTKDEILKYYKQIENSHPDQIRDIVVKELQPNNRIGFLEHFVGACVDAHELKASIDEESCSIGKQEDLENICKESIKKNKFRIKEILQNNPNYTNYVIDVIMLLAPAIAQEYFGISAMAIVGSITIICKQGIHSYLQ